MACSAQKTSCWYLLLACCLKIHYIKRIVISDYSFTSSLIPQPIKDVVIFQDPSCLKTYSYQYDLKEESNFLYICRRNKPDRSTIGFKFLTNLMLYPCTDSPFNCKQSSTLHHIVLLII